MVTLWILDRLSVCLYAVHICKFILKLLHLPLPDVLLSQLGASTVVLSVQSINKQLSGFRIV